MEWMTDIQLSRCNLSAIQRISVAEKYRPVYKKQAKENQKLAAGRDRRSSNYQNQGLENPTNLESKNNKSQFKICAAGNLKTKK